MKKRIALIGFGLALFLLAITSLLHTPDKGSSYPEPVKQTLPQEAGRLAIIQSPDGGAVPIFASQQDLVDWFKYIAENRQLAANNLFIEKRMSMVESGTAATVVLEVNKEVICLDLKKPRAGWSRVYTFRKFVQTE